MKSFANRNAKDFKDAVRLLQQASLNNRNAAIASGGTDVLPMMKERLITPDILVSLKGVRSNDRVSLLRGSGGDVRIGGLITLDALSRDKLIRAQYPALAQAAEQVGTPQIRNAGTLAGNICQRPWCWYYRNGFPCHKNGGNTCFSENGENQFHAIFGGGPSFIVHPSDTAPALVALDARFRLLRASGERTVTASEFFRLPSEDPTRENALQEGEILTDVYLPSARPGIRSTYHKVMDREAWTHAVVSVALVLEMDQHICRSARIALGGVAPIPWRLPRVESVLEGQTITPELASTAGALAIEGAQPLAKNGYKVQLVAAVVKRTILSLGTTGAA